MRSQLDLLAIGICLALIVLLAQLVNGCTPQRPPLPPQERAWVDAAAGEWRDLQLAWSPACDRMLSRLVVDREIGRCEGLVWGCFEDARIHVHPDVERERGEGAYLRTLVHELGHGFVQCSGLDPYGDPGHLQALWEDMGGDGWVRRAQRRAGGIP